MLPVFQEAFLYAQYFILLWQERIWKYSLLFCIKEKSRSLIPVFMS